MSFKEKFYHLFNINPNSTTNNISKKRRNGIYQINRQIANKLRTNPEGGVYKNEDLGFSVRDPEMKVLLAHYYNPNVGEKTVRSVFNFFHFNYKNDIGIPLTKKPDARCNLQESTFDTFNRIYDELIYYKLMNPDGIINNFGKTFSELVIRQAYYELKDYLIERALFFIVKNDMTPDSNLYDFNVNEITEYLKNLNTHMQQNICLSDSFKYSNQFNELDKLTIFDPEIQLLLLINKRGYDEFRKNIILPTNSNLSNKYTEFIKIRRDFLLNKGLIYYGNYDRLETTQSGQELVDKFIDKGKVDFNTFLIEMYINYVNSWYMRYNRGLKHESEPLQIFDNRFNFDFIGHGNVTKRSGITGVIIY